MFLLVLAACLDEGAKDTGDPACEAYPPPRFHISVVDELGEATAAERAWAEDPEGNVFEAQCDDTSCVEWSGIAADGAIVMYASAGAITSLGVDGLIVRDDAHCSVEEASATVVLDPCPDCE